MREKVLNTRLEGARREGIEEGTQQRSLEIAKNMLKENLDISIIMKVTGFSKKQLEELK